MPSREETVQATIKTIIPTAKGSVNENWHSYLNYKAIPAGHLAERKIALYLQLFPAEAKTVTASVAERYFLHNPSAIVA